MRLRPTGASGPDATSAGVGCTPLCFLSGFLPLTGTWPSVWCGSPAPHCPPPHRATRPESCSTSAWVASQCPWSVVCVRSRDTAASAFARVTAEPSTVSAASTRPAGRAQAPPLASAAARQRFPPATANLRAPISGGAPLTAGRSLRGRTRVPPATGASTPGLSFRKAWSCCAAGSCVLFFTDPWELLTLSGYERTVCWSFVDLCLLHVLQSGHSSSLDFA